METIRMNRRVGARLNDFVFRQKCIPWCVREGIRKWSDPSLFKEWSIGLYKMGLVEGRLQFMDYPGVHSPVLTKKSIREDGVRSVADPFLVFKDGIYYMIFEIVKKEKGVIGLAESKDCRIWEYKSVVLEEPFHLSYPFVFKMGEEYYMLPESYETNSVRLYRALRFPGKWEFVKTLVEGKDFADPTIILYKDKLWLFVSDASSENLYLFHADTLEGLWEEHLKSPIFENDLTKARPAGNVMRLGDKLIRIAQNCYPYYGNSVRAFEITRLDVQEYEEKELAESPLLKASGKGWNKVGMHHLSSLQMGEQEWIAAVDGKTMKNKIMIDLATRTSSFLSKWVR